MTFTRLLVAALALATLSVTARAEDPYKGVHLIRGTVVSVGRADPRGDDTLPNQLESGPFFDVNYSSVFINGGFGTKLLDDANVVNAYAGIGFGRILQLQAGFGDRGPLGRIRTDINLRSIYNFVTQTRQPKRERTLADRITFTYTAEQYSRDESEEFDNATIGIGLLFDGPF